MKRLILCTLLTAACGRSSVTEPPAQPADTHECGYKTIAHLHDTTVTITVWEHDSLSVPCP